MNRIRVLLLICATALAAQKELPPAGTAPKPFHLPSTQDFALANGMKVTLVPYGVVPKVAVYTYVDAGGVYEPADQIWISKLNALLMKEGTTARSAVQLAREAADMGGQVEIDAGSEFTTAGGVVLSEFGPKFVSLIAEVLKTPLLPASELARLKADMGRNLAVDKTRPQVQARERFLQVLFPDHPFGRLLPSESALKGYTLEQVRAFYKNNFSAARTHLYVAGVLDPALRPSIEKAFSDWGQGAQSSIPTAKAVRARSLSVIDRPGAQQSTLYIGLGVPDPTSADYIPLVVMDSILGGSFASRITSNIREQKGYTYSPFSQVETRTHLALWYESADVTTAVTGPSLKEILYEIDRLRRDPPSKDELGGIQNYLAGIFILRNTISPSAVISQLHFVDSQGLPRSFLSGYVQRVTAATPADVQRIAESYLVPNRMTIVVVGDKAKIADQIKGYEAVQ